MALVQNQNFLAANQNLTLSQNKTGNINELAGELKISTTLNIPQLITDFQNGKIKLADLKSQLTKAGIKYTETSSNIKFTHQGKNYTISLLNMPVNKIELNPDDKFKVDEVLAPADDLVKPTFGTGSTDGVGGTDNVNGNNTIIDALVEELVVALKNVHNELITLYEGGAIDKHQFEVLAKFFELDPNTVVVNTQGNNLFNPLAGNNYHLGGSNNGGPLYTNGKPNFDATTVKIISDLVDAIENEDTFITLMSKGSDAAGAASNLCDIWSTVMKWVGGPGSKFFGLASIGFTALELLLRVGEYYDTHPDAYRRAINHVADSMTD